MGTRTNTNTSSTNTNTVFVPAPPKPPRLLAWWAASLSLSLSARPSLSVPSSASTSAATLGSAPGGIPSPKSRRAGGLKPILEEGEGEPHVSTSVRPSASTSASKRAHALPALIHASTPQLFAVHLHRCLALAFWPLRVLLLPVRSVLRFVMYCRRRRGLVCLYNPPTFLPRLRLPHSTA
ncbi:hypothetical protein FB451DRAFT_1571585 [Mycena latifolia]|nr:hypothetical protein FB451DRAFT_1571585 [Mycena latifolia]